MIRMATPSSSQRLVRTFYPDVRDDGRWLQVAWYPGHSMAVLSIWRGDVCVATTRLDRADTVEMIGDLVNAMSTPPQPLTVDVRAVGPAQPSFGRRLSARIRRHLPFSSY